MEHSAIVGTGAIVRVETRVEIAAPVHTVWDALTDIRHVRHWWADGEIEGREGGRIVLGEGNALFGTIKVFAPPLVLAFTWHDIPAQAEHPEWLVHETCGLVHIDLVTQAQETTRLTLVQHNPAGNAPGAAEGWAEIIGQQLPAYLAQH